MVRLLLINPRFPESFWSFKWAVDEIWDGLLHWHETNGTPLFPTGRVASAID